MWMRCSMVFYTPSSLVTQPLLCFSLAVWFNCDWPWLMNFNYYFLPNFFLSHNFVMTLVVWLFIYRLILMTWSLIWISGKRRKSPSHLRAVGLRREGRIYAHRNLSHQLTVTFYSYEILMTTWFIFFLLDLVACLPQDRYWLGCWNFLFIVATRLSDNRYITDLPFQRRPLNLTFYWLQAIAWLFWRLSLLPLARIISSILCR